MLFLDNPSNLEDVALCTGIEARAILRLQEKSRRSKNRMTRSVKERRQRQNERIANFDRGVDRTAQSLGASLRKRKVKPVNPNARREHGRRVHNKNKTQTRTQQRLIAEVEPEQVFESKAQRVIRERGGHAPRAGRNRMHPNKARRQRQQQRKAEEITRREHNRVLTDQHLVTKEIRRIARRQKRTRQRTNRVKINPESFPEVVNPLKDINLMDFVTELNKLIPGKVKTGSIVFSYIYQLYRSENVLDKVIATNQFIHAFDAWTEVHEYLELFRRCLPVWETTGEVELKDQVSDFDYYEHSYTITPESLIERALPSWDLMMNFMNAFLSSKIFHALTMFIKAIVSMNVLPDSILRNYLDWQSYIPPKLYTIADGLIAIFESVKTFYGFILGLVRGDSLADLLVSHDDIGTVLNRAKWLIMNSEHIYYALPIEGFIDHIDYKVELDEVLKYVSSYMKSLSKLDRNYLKVCDYHNRLTVIKNALLTGASQPRPPPLSICLVGKAGIGKSHLIDFVLRLYSGARGRTHSDNMVFHRNMASEYTEGYNPLQHIYWHYPEMGNVHRNIIAKKGDPMLAEFQTLHDGQPMALNMAFEGKGKIYARPEVIITDTNNIGMNADVAMAHPNAIYRRFLYVLVSVKPEFRKEGSDSIDIEKSMASDRHFLDKYDFTVMRRDPQGASYQEVVLFRTGDLREFSLYMKEYFLKEIRKQDETLQERVDLDLDNILDGRDPQESPLYGEEKVHFEPESYTETSEMSKLFYAMTLISEIGGSGFKLGYTYLLYFLLLISLNSALAGTFLGLTVGLMLFWLQCSLMLTALCAVSLVLFYTFVDKHRRKLEVWKKFLHLKARLRLNIFTYFSGLSPYKIDIDSRYLTHLKYISGLTLILMTLYLIRKYFARVKYNPEHKTSHLSVLSEYNEKILDTEEKLGVTKHRRRFKKRPDIWNTSHYTHVENPLYTDSAPSLYRALSTNMRIMRLMLPDGEITNNYLFGLRGTYAVFNYHALKGHSTAVLRVSITREDMLENRYQEIGFKLSEAVVVSKDICVFDTQNLQFRDALKHLITDYFPGTFPGSLCDEPIRTQLFYNGDMMIDGRNEPMGPLFHYRLHDHAPGLCGLPLFIETQTGSLVAGIHVGGVDNSPVAFGIPLVKHEMEEAINEVQRKIGLLEINSRPTIVPEFSLEDPVPKSPFLYENFDCLEYYGKLEGPVMVNNKSKVTKHKWYDVMTEYLIDNGIAKTEIFGKPMMKPITRRGEYISPWNIGLRKMNNIPPNLDVDILSRCIDEIVDYVFAGLNERGIHTMSPFTMMEAINGIARDDYFSRINTSTSGGPDFPGTKDKHLPLVSQLDEEDSCKVSYNINVARNHQILNSLIDEGVLDPSSEAALAQFMISTEFEALDEEAREIVILISEELEDLPTEYIREPTDYVKSQVFKLLSHYLNDESAMVRFRASLKDEMRVLEKCQNGSTRLFYIISLAYLIVSRMILGPVYTLIVEHGDLFGSSVGINMHADAHDMIEEMKDFSPLFMEGDYSGFDVRNPIMIARAANTVIYNLCERLGYNESALQVLKGVLSDGAFPIIELNLDLFVKPGLQPSGKYGTAEDNCLRGLIMVMYAYYIHPQLQDTYFYDNVLVRTYGDDILAVVKEEISEYFHCNYYQHACYEHFNMIFTTATKSSEMENFLSWDKVSFLRRTFVPFPNGRYVAPLVPSTIHKIFEMYIPSRTESFEDQVVSTLQSGFSELFFHIHDPIHFTEMRSDIIDIIASHTYVHDEDQHECRVRLLENTPTYDELYQRVFGEDDIGLPRDS